MFSERDLILGYCGKGDAQLHTKFRVWRKTLFGTNDRPWQFGDVKGHRPLFKNPFKSAEEITILEIDLSYLSAIHVGDTIQGKFQVEDLESPAGRPKKLSMTFEVTKNGQQVVSKGSMRIEAAGNR